MAGEQLRTFLRRLRRVAGPEVGGLSDAQLLERFVRRRDEAAFEVLVWRHGGLVLHVCGRLLRHAEDIEDVFQATFLALSRWGESITRAEAVASWLYKVASRLALRVRSRAAREAMRPTGERAGRPRPGSEGEPDVRPILDEEINRLPQKYRAAVVLCYLEGRTTEEAARQLGCARGTVCSRLAWARQRLRGRLTRRGLALTAAALTAGLAPAAAPAAPSSLSPLVAATVKAAVLFASGQAAGGALPGSSVALAEGVLRAMMLTRLKMAGVLLVLGVLGLGAGLCTQRVLAQKPGAEKPILVRGNDGVRLPEGMAAKVGIQVAEVKPRAAAIPRVLRLRGSLAIDPTRVVRIRARFGPCEVVQIRQVPEPTGSGRAEMRDLRTGDRVRKGDVLAVFSSAEVGSKKNDLFDALIQLKLDEEILERAEKAADAVPEVFRLNARRNVAADRNAVNRAVNALRMLGVPEKDIEDIRKEAREAGDARRPKEAEEKRKARADRWARVELRAPDDGTIVERNIVPHEIIVDVTVNLFQIARLDKLLVLVNAPADELPALNALAPAERVWSIRPAGTASEWKGPIEEIGYLIDPNQHTAVLKGHIDNPDGKLRAGQFITASINLPPAAGEVVLPAAAVVEDGRHSFVFVQPDAAQSFYEQRRVLVVRRGENLVHIRSRLTPEQERQGLRTVRPGERVVTSGGLELKALLDDLKAAEDR